MFHFHGWSKWKLEAGSQTVQTRECVKCGKIERREMPHVHDWGKWQIIQGTITWIWGSEQSATYQIRECLQCGKKQHEAVG